MSKPKHKRKVQVVIVALNDNKPSLLLLKTNEKRGHFWQNVTGGVENSEKSHMGAIRELAEETGLAATELKQLGITFKFECKWGGHAKEKCFLHICEREIPITIDPNEHCEYKWVPLTEVDEKTFKHASNYACFVMAKDLL